MKDQNNESKDQEKKKNSYLKKGFLFAAIGLGIGGVILYKKSATAKLFMDKTGKGIVKGTKTVYNGIKTLIIGSDEKTDIPGSFTPKRTFENYNGGGSGGFREARNYKNVVGEVIKKNK